MGHSHQTCLSVLCAGVSLPISLLLPVLGRVGVNPPRKLTAFTSPFPVFSGEGVYKMKNGLTLSKKCLNPFRFEEGNHHAKERYGIPNFF